MTEPIDMPLDHVQSILDLFRVNLFQSLFVVTLASAAGYLAAFYQLRGRNYDWPQLRVLFHVSLRTHLILIAMALVFGFFGYSFLVIFRCLESEGIVGLLLSGYWLLIGSVAISSLTGFSDDSSLANVPKNLREYFLGWLEITKADMDDRVMYLQHRLRDTAARLASAMGRDEYQKEITLYHQHPNHLSKKDLVSQDPSSKEEDTSDSQPFEEQTESHPEDGDYSGVSLSDARRLIFAIVNKDGYRGLKSWRKKRFGLVAWIRSHSNKRSE